MRLDDFLDECALTRDERSEMIVFLAFTRMKATLTLADEWLGDREAAADAVRAGMARAIEGRAPTGAGADPANEKHVGPKRKPAAETTGPVPDAPPAPKRRARRKQIDADGHENANPKITFDAATVARMSELYESGLTLPQVGEAVGCSKDTVARIFREHGVEIRARGHRRSDPKEPKTEPDTRGRMMGIAEELGMDSDRAAEILDSKDKPEARY